ncbi:hypothetical protein [Albirhodobacter sp. R86504]|uniref:hypothetical protein n=1 Tax=Albirhodobacter sp. R86504 TaxID=3093848 RepID=UPI00366FCCB5
MEILPREIVTALQEKHKRESRPTGRLHVDANGETWRVLRRWRGGFSLDASKVAHLRGAVDLYDGPRHEAHCLIVASEIVSGELICTSKRETKATHHAALDFVRENDVPILLGSG